MAKVMQFLWGVPIKAGRTCIWRNEVVMYLAVGLFCPRFSKQSLVLDDRVKVRPFCTRYTGSGMIEYSFTSMLSPQAVTNNNSVSENRMCQRFLEAYGLFLFFSNVLLRNCKSTKKIEN